MSNAVLSDEDQTLYVVSIKRKNKNFNQFVHYAAASMVTPYFGVTIAHCALEIKLNVWGTLINKVNYIVWSRNDDKNPEGVTHYIEKVHCPKAKDKTTDKDYAILKVSCECKIKLINI